MLKERVMRKLFEVYGPDPAVQCLTRLEEELAGIQEKNYEDDVLLINKLREAAGCEISVWHNAGASFLNWLTIGTQVNPLPPHYSCAICGKTVFLSEGDAWDLPILTCCGRPLVPDGHNIPFESVRQRMASPRHQMEFGLPENFMEQAVKIIRTHYAGKLSLIPYSDPFDHEYTFALVPAEDKLPVLNEKGVWEIDVTSLFRLKYRIVKLYREEGKEKLEVLAIKTGVRPELKDLLVKPVLEAVQTQLRKEITETTEPTEAFETAKPPLQEGKLSFSLLMKMEGYLHAMYYEDNPALAMEGSSYANVFTCREDVWDIVSHAIKPEYGVSLAFAGKVTKITRMGGYTNGRMDIETEQLLKKLDVSEQWITQMKYTGYLPAKSEIIGKLVEKMTLAWYKIRAT